MECQGVEKKLEGINILHVNLVNWNQVNLVSMWNWYDHYDGSWVPIFFYRKLFLFKTYYFSINIFRIS